MTNKQQDAREFLPASANSLTKKDDAKNCDLEVLLNLNFKAFEEQDIDLLAVFATQIRELFASSQVQADAGAVGVHPDHLKLLRPFMSARDGRLTHSLTVYLREMADPEFAKRTHEARKRLYGAAAESDKRDAERWRTFERALYSGHLRGTAYGRRFKIIETCPMSGDEKEFNAFVEAIDAARATEGETE